MAKKFVIWDDETKELGAASSFRRQWIRDFFSSPFWDNIPDKPSKFPPEAHASAHAKGGSDELSLDASQIVSGVLSVDRIPDLPRSKITDFFSSPFWDNIPDKPSYFPSKASLFTVDNHIKPPSGATYDLGDSSKDFRIGWFSQAVRVGRTNVATFPSGQGGYIGWNYPSGTGATVFFNHHGGGSVEYIFYSTTDWQNFTELLRITNSQFKLNIPLVLPDGTSISSKSDLGGKALIASDETELSTTSTSNVSLKQFNMVKLSGAGLNWSKMTIVVEGYIDTSGQTAYLDIYIGGTKYATITWTETSYTLKYKIIDISGLGDGKHLVDLQMRVTGGTGYLRLVEVWVE